MKKLSIIAAIVLSLVLVAESCKKTIAVTDVTLNQTSSTITVGDTLRLIPTIEPLDATNKNVTWLSSEPAIATVNNGLITALDEGETTITVTTVCGKKTATCVITVEPQPIPVESISLNITEHTLYVFDTVVLIASILPINASNQDITWESSNPKLATVTDGVVVAIAEGTVSIFAVTNEGAHKVVCELTIELPPMRGGGPYILYADNGSVTIHTFDRRLNLFTRYYPNREAIEPITVYSHEGDYVFTFELQKNPTKIPLARYKNLPEKMLVLSDPHADIVPFVRTLQGNGVIDDNLNWTFGNGHLKILGDVQDRGDDQTTIFWLLYKLQAEAQAAGGDVHHLLGNHEAIVAQYDERYLNPKYIQKARNLAKYYGVFFAYTQLWHNNSELGSWVNSRNTVQIMGNMLFVHAGISPQVSALPLTIENINDTVRKYIVLPNSTSSGSPHANTIMGSSGVLWYRAIAENTIQESVLDQILARWSNDEEGIIKHMILGHTRVNQITSFYNGKSIVLDVSNVRRTNITNGRSLGLWVTPETHFPVNVNGERREFIHVAPPIAQ